MYTLLTNKYAYETETLLQIVTAAITGVMHSSLMTNTDMENRINAVKQKLKKKTIGNPAGYQAI